MRLNSTCKPLISSAIILGITACGSSGSGYSTPEPIKLSGPATLSAIAADASAADGSVSIADTMTDFPTNILTDFATRFPDVTAEEQYRKISYSAGVITEERFGVEGESANDTEAYAEYSENGNFLSSVSTTEDTSLPANVADTLSALYPSAIFDEVETSTDHNAAVTWEVEIESGDAEVELMLDATGTLLTTTEEITASAVPAAALSKIQQELQGLSEIEYEMITDNISGNIIYEGELETESESVSIRCAENGDIISIEYEGTL